MATASNKITNNKSSHSMLTHRIFADYGDRDEKERNSLALNIEEEEPPELQPFTSHSVKNSNRRLKRRGDGAQRRSPSKMCSQKRRSDTDIIKTRPLIVSPFMPTFATQLSQKRRRANTNSLPGGSAALQQSAPSTNAVHCPRIAGSKEVLIIGEAKYGTVPSQKQQLKMPTAEQQNQVIKQTIPESESENESESSSSSESSIYTRFSDLTKKQWATIGMLAIANLCSTVAFSCIAPFFPKEAELKGMNQSEIGLVFGIFELIMFVITPVLGKYMASIGSKSMFIIGLLITGVTAIAFGMLNLLPSGRVFFWSALFIRCAQASGDACFVTACFVIGAKYFQGRIATIVGIMETFTGLGYSIGPFIGGLLYEYGDFQLPFFVLGFLLILATILSYYLIDKIDDKPTDDAMGMFPMLKIPVIWLMICAVVICAISLSFFDPTLANHLKSFNLSPKTVGLMFLLFDGFYCLTAPLWGLLLDRWHCCNALMLFGSIATVFSLILIGPMPFLNVEKNLILIGFSLAVLGIASGALYIPTFQNCLDAVKEYGYDDSFQTYGYVSGIFQSAFAFGAFLGPTLGSISVENFGLPITTTITAGIIIVFIFALITFFTYKRFSSQYRINNKR